MCNGATLRVACVNFVRFRGSRQAVGMTDPPKTIDHVTEAFQESLSILVIEEDVLPHVASASDMV